MAKLDRDTQVKNAGPGRHSCGANLFLVVAETGAKTWLFRFQLNGKRRDMGLGAYPLVSLAKARKEADAAREMVARGQDPVEARKQAKAVSKASEPTFKDVAETLITDKGASWRNDKHRAQWVSTLQSYVFPVFGDWPVRTVNTEAVLSVLRPIWTTKPETASRVRGRIEAVLDAAKARGLFSGECPARWRGHLDHILPKPSKLTRGHHSALAFADLPAFMTDLRGRDAVSARALEFLILTAGRTSEVTGATWSEVDWDRAVWTVPPERMKAGRPHHVPLSPRALSILTQMRDAAAHRPIEGGFVFAGPSGRALSTAAMSALLNRRMGHPDKTVHGFRSAFRDWVAEATNHDHQTAEMALAHAVGSKVELAYRRGNLLDKRRRLMEDWANYCKGKAPQSDNILAFRNA